MLPGIKARSSPFLTPQMHEAVSEESLPQPSTAKLIVGYDFSGIDSQITITGSGISGVTDTSGQGNHGTQTVDARRCLYGAATINGKLVADSAAARCVELPSPVAGWANNGQPPMHALVLVRVTSFTAARYIWRFEVGTTLRGGLRLQSSGGQKFESFSPAAGPGTVSVLQNGTMATATTYLVETAVDGSGNLTTIVNEGAAATVAGGGDSGETINNKRVFAISNIADSVVGAFYLFNDALSAGELDQWRAFLKQRWAY